MGFGLLLAFVLSLADYFTEGLFSRTNQKKIKFISFSAGVSVAYLFLILLPEIYSGAITTHRLLFLSVLLGFSMFHVIEKLVRQNYHGSQLRREHVLIHSSSSFVYFFVVGFILVDVTRQSHTAGVLFFFPLLLHIIIDSLPKRATKKIQVKIFSASSVTLGALMSTFVDLGTALSTALLGIVGGGLLYQVIRESLPKDREGKPMFFITGLLSFTVLILLLWNLGF